MRARDAAFGGRVQSTVRAAVLSVALLFCATPLFAQPALIASLGRAFNAVSSIAADATSRQTTAASIEAEHQFAGERLRVFYEMDAGTFTTPGDWHYSLNSAGATYRVSFGASGSNRFYVTGSGTWRANGVDWGTADFRAVGLRANVEMKPRETATIRFGYRLDKRTFPDLAELDQVEHDGFFSALFNFATRTTLLGEIHVGAKSYQASSPIVANAGTNDTMAQQTAGRYGRGMGPRLRVSALASAANSIRAEQVSWLARVAQSLTDRTGVTLQLAQRARFGRIPPVLVTTPAAFFDDGVYDDPFASNAWTVSTRAKRQFERGVVIEAGASWAKKDYSGAVPFDVEGLPIAGALRGDRIVRAGVGGSVPLFAAKTGRLALDLDMGYFLVRHRSNDAFYNYTSHGAGGGVSISY